MLENAKLDPTTILEISFLFYNPLITTIQRSYKISDYPFNNHETESKIMKLVIFNG